MKCSILLYRDDENLDKERFVPFFCGDGIFFVIQRISDRMLLCATELCHGEYIIMTPVETM